LKRIFDVSVPKGSIALALLNTYSTLVVKTDSLTAIFDPVEIKIGKDEKIDLIIITHEHSDHFDQGLAIDIQRQQNAHILTTPFIAQKLRELGGFLRPLKIGDSFESTEMAFCAEYSNHPGNQPLSFVICHDVATIYHPNDSRPFPEMRSIRRKYNPDLMVYTGNSLKEIPEIAELIRPKTILSYRDQRFKDMEIPGIEIKTVKHGEVYSYSPYP